MDVEQTTTETTQETAAETATDTTAGESLDIQGITPPSEQDLMGIFTEDEAETKQEAQEKATEETATESTKTAPSESKAAEGEKETTEQSAKTETDEQQVDEAEAKPPKGYVPLAAVHEARGEIRYLKEQIAALTEKVSKGAIDPPAPPKDETPEEFKDFKELSPKELEALVLEDPAEAILYTHKLQKFNTFRSTQEQLQRAANEAKQRERLILNTAYGRMEEAVPGIFDHDSDVSTKLASFAKEIGFGTDLFYLTDPATKIIPSGSSEPVVLGEGAASIVEMLANVRNAFDKHAASPTETQIREKLTQEITEKVQKDLLEKFKTEPSKDQFTSLAAASGTDAGDTGIGKKSLSPDEFGKLTPQQMELYLSGA